MTSKKSDLDLSAPSSHEVLFRKLFWAIIIIAGVLLPLLSLNAGLNADERFQVYIADYITPFYSSFGEDQRVLLTKDEVMPTFEKGGMEAVQQQFGLNRLPPTNDMRNYGGLFELTSKVVATIFGIDSVTEPAFFNVRHFLLGIITVICLLFTGLIAKELLGWRAAFLAVILLLVSPRFIGHGMMNSKDIPFAMGYIIATYYIIRFLRSLPAPTWKTTIGVMVGMALALNMRVGAMLLMFYFGLFSMLFWFYFQYIKKENGFDKSTLGKTVLKAFTAGVGGYFLGLLFWPYGLLDPLFHPYEVLKSQSEFPIFINQLFEGEVVRSNELPNYYLSKFIYMTTPLSFLVGLVAGVVMIVLNRKQTHLGLWAFLAFTVLFPLLYLGYNHTNVYNGWRHLIFVYPAMVVIAAVGFEYLLRHFTKPALQYGVITVVVLLSAPSVYWMATNWSYQYVYFNPLIGGIEGAFGQYSTDYYMNGVKEATTWLKENEKLELSTNDTIIVATDCVFPVQVYLSSLGDKVKVEYTEYKFRTDKDWDYGIFYSEYVTPHQLQNALWPPKGSVYNVKAGGVPICTVLKRTDKNAFTARQLMISGQFAEAIPFFEKALETHDDDEALYSGLGLCYIKTGKVKQGINMIEYSLTLNPQHSEGLDLKKQLNKSSNKNSNNNNSKKPF